MEFADRVACDLAENGDLESLGNNALAIKSYQGRQCVPPVTVRLGGVAEYLESMAEDAVQVFPEVHVQEGAYRLLLVHLEEALLVTGGDPSASLSKTEELSCRALSRRMAEQRR